MTKKWVRHNGEVHELELHASHLCANCRFLEAEHCKLFGIPAGHRPALCIASEGEARALRSAAENGWADRVGERSVKLRRALEALAKTGSRRSEEE